jgi:hypothetical protein
MTARGLRSRWEALEPQSKAAIVSIVISLVLIIATMGQMGDFYGGFTDHFQHSHQTWGFLHVGTKVWTLPWREAAALAPPYAHPAVTWPDYPMPYPAGMCLVFLPMTLLGQYVKLSDREFGKIVIIYLMLITTAANWHFAALLRRVQSAVWTVVLVMVWIFTIRASLNGFYDGAWFLFALLCVRALERKAYARSVLWLVVCAWINYRAVSFAPFGAIAFWELIKGSEPTWKKIAITAFAAVSAVIVATTFYWMVSHSPHDKTGVASALLPLKVRGWTLLVVGFGLAAALFRGTSKLTSATVALSTLFCVLHAGHSWHGMLALAPLAALSISERRPMWAQIAIGLWVLLMWRFAMYYEPWSWLEELFLFIERNGNIQKP